MAAVGPGLEPDATGITASPLPVLQASRATRAQALVLLIGIVVVLLTLFAIMGASPPG